MFPHLYHAQHSSYTQDLPFWLNLAAESAGRILELGCGTGRVLLPLAQAGHAVVGLDHDLAMLRFCADRIPSELRPKVSLLQSDMTTIHLGVNFGLILLPCNTLSTLSAESLRAVLDCAQRHLQPGGIFSASMPNPYMLKHLPLRSAPEIETVLPHPQDGRPVEVSSAWEHDRQQFCLTWYYDHHRSSDEVDRWQITIKHQLILPETYREFLSDAGFAQIDFFGDFSGSPYRKRSHHLIITAKR
jgi:SAM-dependent methyltransferase